MSVNKVQGFHYAIEIHWCKQIVFNVIIFTLVDTKIGEKDCLLRV